jgi:hypothetical protein
MRIVHGHFSNTSDLEFINKTANAWVSLRWTGTDGVRWFNNYGQKFKRIVLNLWCYEQIKK